MISKEFECKIEEATLRQNESSVLLKTLSEEAKTLHQKFLDDDDFTSAHAINDILESAFQETRFTDTEESSLNRDKLLLQILNKDFSNLETYVSELHNQYVKEISVYEKAIMEVRNFKQKKKQILSECKYSFTTMTNEKATQLSFWFIILFLLAVYIGICFQK